MQAEIITIGDELLIGQVVDTNSAWMAQRLNALGISLKQITSVHDDREHILAALDEAFRRADIVLTTGGLGPTKDDITKLVLCEYFHTSLVEDPQVKEHIHHLYAERPDVLNRLTETQWQVPQAADILTNRVGSAPIMVFRHVGGKGQPQWLISMPGVPYEMQIAMTEQIEPWLIKNALPASLTKITHLTAMVSGIPESSLSIHLEEWETALPYNIHLAYLPKDGTIRLRLSGYGASPEVLKREFDTMCGLVKQWLVLTEDIPLEEAVGRLLKQRGLTIATAESCTGGRLAALLNARPGSSVFYKGSVVAYSNEVKEKMLKVRKEYLDEYGAVSEKVVAAMAYGAMKLLDTDIAIATSGIAGPDGGTPDKPVGTVWMAWATRDSVTTKCFQLGKLRDQITARACTKALTTLLQMLQ